MITIKEFAELCSCGTQTLRYYDRIDLLKPVQVDPWSGYRYYSRDQAIDFIKIKNLQAADFSISEIKALLTKSDQQVYEAFEAKIAQQEQKLERIREIQRSYLTEKNNMEKIIHGLSDFLTSQLSDFEILREFGLTPEDGPEHVARIKTYIEEQTRRGLPAEPDIHLIVNDRVVRGAENVAQALRTLSEDNLSDTVLLGDENVGKEDPFAPENCETVWECHGWDYVHQFIDQIPQMEEGRDYCFFFRLTGEKYRNEIGFPLFMISTMIPRVNSENIIMGCAVYRSDDGQNHFALKCTK